ncbi:MAG: ABC transporter ATP-binding protein [Pseudomonadales bacterium]|nr:ABC transporter ATP-binding protein [Pseudomonadales bacterium]NNL10338.1 ABC transporter ATP-binding protein [Pseudomonadales bacterium]RZV59194.1 MAG: ABC transporter ATP-binding protein [Pseudomonadales bacterium]
MTTASPNARIALRAKSLGRHLLSDGQRLEILEQIDFSIEAGRSCAILGASGSGKTTLLGMLAGMDPPDSGTVCLEIDGQSLDLYSLDEDYRAMLRARYMGFVFQDFQLLPDMTALDNVLVPLTLLNGGDEAVAKEWLARVGLGQRLQHYPRQLSGGEQQRVALARAFAHQPALLFADEPTGSLDARTSATVVELLFNLQRESGSTMILVTHDETLAARCDSIFALDAAAS